jgi:hypothetical protein
MQTKNPKQPKPSAKRGGNVERRRGLVLDDFLTEISHVRRGFQLIVPQFGLKEMQQYPRAREALEMLIRSTMDRHGTDICSKREPLLSEIAADVYLEPVVTQAYSGWRISPTRIGQSLEKLLEVSLQTLSQLPKRYPKPDYSPRKPRLVALHLRKVGEEAGVLFQKAEVLDRVRAYFADNSEDRARLLRIAEEMRWAADALNATFTKTRVVKSQINANPQIRFALYIAGWFEASTGRQQYEPLETLVTAAFAAAGKQTPKWAGRLAIEMHLERQRRRRHAASILIPKATTPLTPLLPPTHNTY